MALNSLERRDFLPDLSWSEIHPANVRGEYWFRNPSILVHHNQDNLPDPQLLELQKRILNPVLAVYTDNGCDSGVSGKIRGEEFKPSFDYKGANHLTVINPMHISVLHAEKYYKAYSHLLDDSSLETFKEMLRETFPEERRFPQVAFVDKALGIKRSNYKNIINMLFLDDPENRYEELFKKDYDKMRELFRSLKGKFGSTKVMAVPYYKDEDGNYQARNVYLSSLEDGRPEFNEGGNFEVSEHADFRGNTYEEMARRLMTSACAEEVKQGDLITEDGEIPHHVWIHSKQLEGLCALGPFLDERGLIPRMINIADFPSRKNKMLPFLERKTVEWQTQSPGAFYAALILPDGRDGYRLHHVASGSGKFGVVKSRPTPEDFVSVDLNRDGTVGSIPIEGITRKGGSVETQEFLMAQLFMAEYFPKFVEIIDGKMMLNNEGNGIRMSPFRSITHGHWGLNSYDPNYMLVVDMKVQEKIVQHGCGVNLADTTRAYSMMKGVIRLAENRGQQKLIGVRNDDHSFDLYELLTEDEAGNVPIDPTYFLKKGIREERINLNNFPFLS